MADYSEISRVFLMSQPFFACLYEFEFNFALVDDCYRLTDYNWYKVKLNNRQKTG